MNELLPFVRLVHHPNGIPDVSGGLFFAFLTICAFGVLEFFLFFTHQLQMPVSLGQLFDGLAIGGIPDEQAQFFYLVQAAVQRLEAGQKKIAHREFGFLCAGQNTQYMVDKLLVPVINYVVCWHIAILNNADVVIIINQSLFIGPVRFIQGLLLIR
jgi:hypothetical protein